MGGWWADPFLLWFWQLWDDCRLIVGFVDAVFLKCKHLDGEPARIFSLMRGFICLVSVRFPAVHSVHASRQNLDNSVSWLLFLAHMY